jgi:hypothetical protein
MTIRKNRYWFDDEGEPLEEWIDLDGCALHDGIIFAQLVRAYQAAYKTAHGEYHDITGFRLYDLSATPLPQADDVVEIDSETNWIREETVCLYEVWNRLNILIKSAPYTDDEGDRYFWGEPGTEESEDGIDPLFYADGFEDLINSIQVIAWFFGGDPPDAIRYREGWKSYIESCRAMLDKMKFVYSVDLANAVIVTITRKVGYEDDPDIVATGNLVTQPFSASLSEYRFNTTTRLYEDTGEQTAVDTTIVVGMEGEVSYSFSGSVGDFDQLETGETYATIYDTSGASSTSASGSKGVVSAYLTRATTGYPPRPLAIASKPAFPVDRDFIGAAYGATMQTLGDINSSLRIGAYLNTRYVTSVTYSLAPDQAALLSGRTIPVEAYIEGEWTAVDSLSETKLSVVVLASLPSAGDTREYSLPLQITDWGRWDFDQTLKYAGQQKFMAYSSENADNDAYANMGFIEEGGRIWAHIDYIVVPSVLINTRLGAIEGDST